MYDISSFSSIIGNLSIFLFIIAGNYAGDLYSCTLRHIFNEYMILKHIIGLFIMLFFVGLLQKNITLFEKIIQSTGLYLWFITIMRSPSIITLFVIVMICILFLLNIYIEDLKNNINIKKENTNIEETSKKINYLQNIMDILFLITFFISLIGTIIFIIILKKSLGDNFDVYNFLLGSSDQECFTNKTYKIFKNNPFFFEWNKNNINNKVKSNNYIPKKLQKRNIK